MNVQIEKNSDSGLAYTVSIDMPNVELQPYIQEALIKKRDQVHMPGFRNAAQLKRNPKLMQKLDKMVYEQFGMSVRADVVSEQVGQRIDALVKEKELDLIEPVSFTKIEGLYEEGADVHLEGTCEVFPELNFSGLSTEKLRNYTPVVAASDIDVAIENVLEQNATWQPTTEAVVLGNEVVANIKELIDGKEPVEEENTLLIREARQDEQLIPGLLEAFVGKKAGETFEHTATFPENWPDKELAGCSVRYDVTVKEVLQKELPTLNAEFLEKNTPVKDEQAFRELIEKQLREEGEKQVQTVLRMRILSECLAQIPVTLPQILVKKEKAAALEKYQQAHPAEACQSWDDLPVEEREKTQDSLAKDLARSMIYRALYQEAVREKAVPQVSEQEIFQAMMQEIMRYPQEMAYMVYEQFMKDREKHSERFRTDLIIDKLLNKMVSDRDIPSTELPFSELSGKLKDDLEETAAVHSATLASFQIADAQEVAA